MIFYSIVAMEIYQCKTSELSGTDFSEVRKKATDFYNKVRKNNRRRPYIRSAYFRKQKIFLSVFWSHLFNDKNYWDQTRRMRYFTCAIELIRKSRQTPKTKENPNKAGELLHRFLGATQKGKQFIVQVKENKKTGRKDLISVFPYKKTLR